VRLFKSRFVRHAAVLQAGGALNSAFHFLGSIGLAYVLGAREQGVWVVANQMYALVFLLASMGLLQVAVTQVAAASARGNVDKVGGWLGALLKGYLVIGLVMLGVGALVLPEAVELWRRVNPDVDPRLARFAWWLLFTPVLDVPRVVAIAALQGTRRMLRMAQVESIGELLRTFLVVGGAVLTGSPAGPVLGSLVGTALASIVAVGIYRQAARLPEGYPLPSVRAIVRGARSMPFRRAYAQGFRFGLIRLTDALGLKVLPPLIVQTFSSSEWVAYLRMAQAIMQLPLTLMQGIGRTALPALAELRGLRADARFRRLFTRATLLGGGGIALGVLVALPLIPLFDWVLPPGYREPVWLLCCILSLASILQAFSIAFDSFYLLTDQLRALFTINVCGLGFGLAASVLLTARFPETGAAWGIVVTMLTVVVHLVFIGAYLRREREPEAREAAEAGA
jgi:O-antigen/teichoic acid export membrane protein